MLQRHVIAQKVYAAGIRTKVGKCSLQCETHWQRICPESCQESASRAARDKRDAVCKEAEEKMSSLFQLPEMQAAQPKSPSKSDREAEPKSMPRKSAPDSDTKKTKSSKSESSNKKMLPLASEAIQRAIESQDNDAFSKAVKSYCASLEEEEHKSKDAQKNLRG